MASLSVITPDTVTLNISTKASNFVSEKRFPKNITLLDFKMKLELISGCNAGTMKLELYTADDQYVMELSDNDALLGTMNVDSGMRIHVSDPTVHLGQFDDVSKVQKFELTESEYAAKTDTVRAFKERNRLGQYKQLSPEEIESKKKEMAERAEEEKTAFDRLNLGDRCQIKAQHHPARLGCIKYLGETDFKEGLWVGIQYDEPVGKNDGSKDGRRYFECSPKYGGFVKPLFVESGDFPEEDLGLGDDEM